MVISITTLLMFFRDGRRIRPSGQPTDLLVMLVRRSGHLVSREELRVALWPEDTFVDFDHGLNNCIRRIRDALGDTADGSRFIEILPKKGYRFIAETRPSCRRETFSLSPCWKVLHWSRRRRTPRQYTRTSYKSL
jgi:DNA-binding winged helix-turn-helix (wHTH) protein